MPLDSRYKINNTKQAAGIKLEIMLYGVVVSLKLLYLERSLRSLYNYSSHSVPGGPPM